MDQQISLWENSESSSIKSSGLKVNSAQYKFLLPSFEGLGRIKHNKQKPPLERSTTKANSPSLAIALLAVSWFPLERLCELLSPLKNPKQTDPRLCLSPSNLSPHPSCFSKQYPWIPLAPPQTGVGLGDPSDHRCGYKAAKVYVVLNELSEFSFFEVEACIVPQTLVLDILTSHFLFYIFMINKSH